MGIKLEVLEGTQYKVEVERDTSGGYVAEIFKPSTDPGVELELVAARYLDGTSNVRDLNRIVREVIDNDHPSLVGVYVGNTEEEASNGNWNE